MEEVDVTNLNLSFEQNIREELAGSDIKIKKLISSALLFDTIQEARFKDLNRQQVSIFDGDDRQDYFALNLGYVYVLFNRGKEPILIGERDIRKCASISA